MGLAKRLVVSIDSKDVRAIEDKGSTTEQERQSESGSGVKPLLHEERLYAAGRAGNMCLCRA